MLLLNAVNSVLSDGRFDLPSPSATAVRCIANELILWHKDPSHMNHVKSGITDERLLLRIAMQSSSVDKTPSNVRTFRLIRGTKNYTDYTVYRVTSTFL